MKVAAKGQRERIVEGMIAVAGRHGYGGASIARVIAQAGVSRATFYECFGDREECFLDAYGEIAGRVERDLVRVDSTRTAGGRRREIIAGLLATAAHDPAAARLVLIEALAAGEVAREQHERLLERARASIDRHLDDPSGPLPRLEISSSALLGGVGNVLAIRVFQGETGRLGELVDDLLAWIDAYSASPGDRRRERMDWGRLGESFGVAIDTGASADAPRAALPRGRSALAPEVVAGEHRDRIVAASARVASEKGYTAMTVADVVAAAGVTREAFYRQFRNKEEAFLAAQSLSLQESIARAAGEFFGEASWPERVWNGLVAMLDYISRHPDLACVQLVESFAAGPPSIRRTFDSRMAYTLFLEDGYRQRPEAERLPRLCSEAIAGAILELLRRQVVRGRTERMLEVAPEATYLALAPFIGSARAIELVEAKAGRSGCSGTAPAAG